MLELLKNWKGKVVIDDTEYDDIQSVPLSAFKDYKCIKLYPRTEKAKMSVVERQTEFRITVKKYMTEYASPEFDFMAQWNDNNPMPLRTMTGRKIKETRGMVYMELHGQAEETITCMRCGKKLTNPISQLYGIGPECRSKIPVLMDIDIDNISEMQKKLVDVTWTGWIVKSAITEEKEI